MSSLLTPYLLYKRKNKDNVAKYFYNKNGHNYSTLNRAIIPTVTDIYNREHETLRQAYSKHYTVAEELLKPFNDMIVSKHSISYITDVNTLLENIRTVVGTYRGNSVTSDITLENALEKFEGRTLNEMAGEIKNAIRQNKALSEKDEKQYQKIVSDFERIAIQIAQLYTDKNGNTSFDIDTIKNLRETINNFNNNSMTTLQEKKDFLNVLRARGFAIQGRLVELQALQTVSDILKDIDGVIVEDTAKTQEYRMQLSGEKSSTKRSSISDIKLIFDMDKIKNKISKYTATIFIKDPSFHIGIQAKSGANQLPFNKNSNKLTLTDLNTWVKDRNIALLLALFQEEGATSSFYVNDDHFVPPYDNTYTRFASYAGAKLLARAIGKNNAYMATPKGIMATPDYLQYQWENHKRCIGFDKKTVRFAQPSKLLIWTWLTQK